MIAIASGQVPVRCFTLRSTPTSSDLETLREGLLEAAVSVVANHPHLDETHVVVHLANVADETLFEQHVGKHGYTVIGERRLHTGALNARSCQCLHGRPRPHKRRLVEQIRRVLQV